MIDRDGLTARLQAFGFDPGQCNRALSALAGSRIPSRRALRAWREIQTAAALLAEGLTAAAVVRALTARYGCSRATAYRRIGAVSTLAPSEKNDGHTAASTRKG